jgi:membrane protein DedA with SNARE-associated domain
MDTLIHADIFFFVTTIAVVVIGAALTIFIVYLIGILRRAKKISEEVHAEALLLRRDLADLRAEVRKRGAAAGSAMDWMGKFMGMNKKSRSKKK